MAERYITKTKKLKGGEVAETTYRIDADFVPTEANQICMEFIENYCVANNQIAWLLEEVNITAYSVKRKNKETGEEYTEVVKCDNYPFVNLRKDFIEKFFPTIIKGNAEKKTWKDILNAKYGKK